LCHFFEAHWPATLRHKEEAMTPTGGAGTARTGRVRIEFGERPPVVLLLIGRLDLAVILLSLFACLIVFDEVPTLGYLGVGIISLLLAGRLITPPDLQGVLSYGAVPTRDVTRVVLEWAGVFAILLFVGFALKVSDIFSRVVMLSWFGSTSVLLILTQEIQVQCAKFLNRRGVISTRHIIVGAGPAGIELARRLPDSAFRGFFDFRDPTRLPEAVALGKLRGRCNEVGDCVRKEKINFVYITLPISNSRRIQDLLADLRDTTATVYFVPDVFGFDLIQAKVVDLNGIPALAICDTPLKGSNAWSKRAMDLALSTIGLLVLLPLLTIIAIAVKLSSKGPIIFRQQRYGLNGDPITVYKFRSMTVCEDGENLTQATRHDMRVTKIGRWLRATSIDELPQLWNVMMGDMSLVGPRPHAVVHNEQYRKQISGYMIRHKVRPGITGWAQVHGLRGETDTLDKMEARVRYDLEYLMNWSLALDVKIILKTIFVIFVRKNAY
jgi:putative colanic acid biosynthesis UDP-glucose lipid carrier transferase